MVMIENSVNVLLRAAPPTRMRRIASVPVHLNISLENDFPNSYTTFLSYLLLGTLLIIMGPLGGLRIENEEQCADLGFCVPARPSFKATISIIGLLPYLLNWCWIHNFFVWTGVALGAFLPILHFAFSAMGAIVPLFNKVASIIPYSTSLQHAGCVLSYSYAPALVVTFLILFRTGWRLIAARVIIPEQKLALRPAIQN